MKLDLEITEVWNNMVRSLVLQNKIQLFVTDDPETAVIHSVGKHFPHPSLVQIFRVILIQNRFVDGLKKSQRRTDYTRTSGIAKSISHCLQFSPKRSMGIGLL